MIDTDEELEAQLYSQVYHSTEGIESEVAPLPPENQEPRVADDLDMNRRRNRYFQKNLNNPNRFEKRTNYGERQVAYNPTQGSYYEKNYAVPHRRSDISINQLVVVNPSPSGNVIYVTTEGRKFSKRQLRRERRRKKKEQLLNEKIYDKVSPNKHTRFDSSVNADNVIITLSETDSDDCIEIVKEIQTVNIESDEEEPKTIKVEASDQNTKPTNTTKFEEIPHPEDIKNTSTESADVIFIQPLIEIINIDEDPEAAPSSTENATPTKNHSENYKPSDRKDLLNTPDSASNDFMSNSSLDLNQQHKFNFSLHGSDFNGGEFLKPARPPDHCESASSSSTATIDVNLAKSVFSEIEFPKEDLFSEANLESFGNLITPVRKQGAKRVLESSTPKGVSYDEIESSESDYEDISLAGNLSNLPNLSHWNCEDVVEDSAPQKKKKAKSKGLNISSKFDLAESEKVRKKKKKSKKKKDSVVSEEVVEESNSKYKSDKEKKKKKKSGDDSENSSKKDNKVIPDNSISQLMIEESNKAEILQQAEVSPSLSKTDKEKKKKRKSVDDSENSAKKKNRVSTDNETGQSTTDKTEDNIVDIASDKVEVSSDTNSKNPENISQILTEEKASATSSTEEKINKALDGFIIIDEVSRELTFINSDTDSNLSELSHGGEDIQLGNLSQSLDENKHRDASVEKENSNKPKLTLVNSSVQEIQKCMSSDPKLWAVLDSDKLQTKVGVRGRRCNRCREFGHLAMRCRSSVVPKCRLCGESGHLEPRCHNRICHQCGARSQYTTTYCKLCFRLKHELCKLCNSLGHVEKSCPDLWRRYHLTTEEGPLVRQEGPVLKQKSQLWCSGCARSGHLENNCNQYRASYSLSDPTIRSYDDIYEDNRQQNTGQALLPLLGPILQNVNNSLFTNDGGNYSGFQPPQFQFNPYLQGRNMLGNRYQVPGFIYGQPGLPPPPPTMTPPSCYFQNNLPTFISFDDNNYRGNNNNRREEVAPQGNFVSRREEVAPQGNFVNNNQPPWRRHGNNYELFLNGPMKEIQIVINTNINNLMKTSTNLKQVVKHLKEQHVSRRSLNLQFYKTANMVLFGIYNISDGKSHLKRLKTFRMATVLGRNKRQLMFESYNYIFGEKPHRNADYEVLLKSI